MEPTTESESTSALEPTDPIKRYNVLQKDSEEEISFVLDSAIWAYLRLCALLLYKRRTVTVLMGTQNDSLYFRVFISWFICINSCS